MTFTTTPSNTYTVDAWGGTNGDEVVEAAENSYTLAVDGKKTVTVSFKSAT